MEFTHEKIQLVKQSWKSLRGINPELIADLFYTKLFTENPRLRSMFPSDMHGQHKKLMDMLSVTILRIENTTLVQDQISLTAQTHIKHGVEPTHYKKVGEALIWTLKQGLGDKWNDELEDAWEVCYFHISNMMIDHERAFLKS